jgi:hypothetical protein
MFNNIFIFENRTVYEIMCKHIIESDRPQVTIWQKRIVCWKHYATNTHPERVKRIAFPLKNGCKNAPQP